MISKMEDSKKLFWGFFIEGSYVSLGLLGLVREKWEGNFLG